MYVRDFSVDFVGLNDTDGVDVQGVRGRQRVCVGATLPLREDRKAGLVTLGHAQGREAGQRGHKQGTQHPG